MKPLHVIHYDGKDYPAVQCERPGCGCLIYPAEDMELHRAMHKLQDTRNKPTIKQLATVFKAMRSNWW